MKLFAKTSLAARLRLMLFAALALLLLFTALLFWQQRGPLFAGAGGAVCPACGHPEEYHAAYGDNGECAMATPPPAPLGGALGTVALWLAAAACVFILLLLCSNALAKSLKCRTGMVLDQIERISNEDYTPHEDAYGDEFRRISDRLNMLSDKMSFLIEQVYKYTIENSRIEIEKQQMSLKRKEAEILSLQNQINPHYFFNTLETIRMNLVINGDVKNSEMIQFFAESLRTYSKSPYTLVPIRDELIFLEKYVKLQNYRFNNRVKCNVDVRESNLDYSVPHFLLQPILENAVVHGFRSKPGTCFIEIAIDVDEPYLYISVSDNGGGIDEAHLDELRHKMETSFDDSAPGQVGIINVNKRIKLLYGSDCGMVVKSKVNCGTEVEIKIKTRLELEENDVQ